MWQDSLSRLTGLLSLSSKSEIMNIYTGAQIYLHAIFSKIVISKRCQLGTPSGAHLPFGQIDLDVSADVSVFIQNDLFKLFLSTLASRWKLLERALLGKKSSVSWYRQPVRHINWLDDGQPDCARGNPYVPAGHLDVAVMFIK